jgi:hypothetical protein
VAGGWLSLLCVVVIGGGWGMRAFLCVPKIEGFRAGRELSKERAAEQGTTYMSAMLRLRGRVRCRGILRIYASDGE